MTVEYEVRMRLDCRRCDEAMAHIVSSRLPDPDKGWSFHLFECEKCGDQQAIYATMSDPQGTMSATIGPCQFCGVRVGQGMEGVSGDPVACTWWHDACLAKAPKRPRPAIYAPNSPFPAVSQEGAGE
jgi:hypothetical protein